MLVKRPAKTESSHHQCPSANASFLRHAQTNKIKDVSHDFGEILVSLLGDTNVVRGAFEGVGAPSD